MSKLRVMVSSLPPFDSMHVQVRAGRTKISLNQGRVFCGFGPPSLQPAVSNQVDRNASRRIGGRGLTKFNNVFRSLTGSDGRLVESTQQG